MPREPILGTMLWEIKVNEDIPYFYQNVCFVKDKSKWRHTKNKKLSSLMPISCYKCKWMLCFLSIILDFVYLIFHCLKVFYTIWIQLWILLVWFYTFEELILALILQSFSNGNSHWHQHNLMLHIYFIDSPIKWFYLLYQETRTCNDSTIFIELVHRNHSSLGIQFFLLHPNYF